MEEDMTQGEQIERLTRLDEQRKILAMLEKQGAEAVKKYLEEQLTK